jgi:hypothetical protein
MKRWMSPFSLPRIVAGKKELAPFWYPKGGKWVTGITARENDDKTPVKADTPATDVLYTSGGQ